MIEKPTLYGWLLKIAIVVVVVVFVRLGVIVDRTFPGFKNTIMCRYILVPVLYVIFFVLVLFFIMF